MFQTCHYITTYLLQKNLITRIIKPDSGVLFIIGYFYAIKIGEGFISDYTLYLANKIYYLQAKTFDSYSPIASKSYHNFDIYSLDLETLEINKNELLITVRGTSSKSGLFLLNINSTNDEQNFNKILIINDTLRNSEMYTNPVILPNGNILSASSYQMVELDLKSKMEYPILPSNGRHYKTIRNISNMIFYKQTDYTDSIYYFNLDNKISKCSSRVVDSALNELSFHKPHIIHNTKGRLMSTFGVYTILVLVVLL